MPGSTRSRQPGPDDIESVIGAYAVGFDLGTVPENIKRRAKLVLLDTVGVSIYGSRTDYIGTAVGTGTEMGLFGDGRSTIFTTGDGGSVLAATVANAAGATTLELDEGNQRSGHMGVHTVPPAVAVAESVGATGTELLEALVLSYEISARVGDLNRPLSGSLHPHGLWAAFGAAVAAGTLYGFDADEYANACRIAANPSLGTHWAAAMEGATVRNFYTGMTCQHGLTAAMLAASGVSGMDSSVRRHLLSRTAKAELESEDIAACFATLDESYYLDGSYFKMHAACRYTHPPLDAIEAMSEAGPIDPESIDRIVVRSFGSAGMLDGTRPHNRLSAKFSVPYAVAAKLCYGTSGVEAFEADVRSDPSVRALAERVEVVVDDEFERRKAENDDWGAEVEIRFEDGRKRSRTVRNARGGGEKPFTEEGVRSKFRRLVGNVASESAVTAIEERILGIEEVGDTTSLFAEFR